MEFENGDYLINIDKLKARFFDEIRSLSVDGTVNCEVENLLISQIKTLNAIEQYGQEME